MKTVQRLASRRLAGAWIFAAAAMALSSGFASPASAEDPVKEAAAIVIAHEKSPAFWAPPSFDTSASRGKTVWWIANQGVNIIQQWTIAGQSAAKLVGLNVHLFDPGAAVEDHARGFQLAIAAKADAIVLGDGYPAVAFSAQIADAKKHGIPVFSLVSHPLGADTEPKVDGLVADISYDYPAAGRLLADWFVADSKGKGNALIIDLQGVPSAAWELQGFKDELKRLGTAVKFTEVSTTIGPAYETETTTVTTSAILRDPSINYIIPPFDDQALFAQNGLSQLGAVGAKVRTAGFNTTLPQMNNLRRGGTPFKIDLGGPNVWLGYAVVDDILRSLNGQPAIHDYHIGYRVFTHENVQGLDLSKEDDKNWYGVDYAALFVPVWRLK